MNEKTNHSCNQSLYVQQAEFCRVGQEWNNNVWDSKTNPTGCHGLYFRTDQNRTKAVLHTLNGDIEILPGYVYFIPAFSVLHSEIDGEMNKYYIHFQSDFEDMGFRRHLLKGCCVPANEMTKGLFDIVVQNYCVKTIAAVSKVRGAMSILLAELMESIMVNQRELEKFEKVLSFIDENYNKNISVSELAEMLNLSTMYFSNVFKKTFHISPKQYILCKRLYESRILLSTTDLSVREIAYKVGFEDENYFSKCFSEKVGVKALKFRAGIRGK